MGSGGKEKEKKEKKEHKKKKSKATIKEADDIQSDFAPALEEILSLLRNLTDENKQKLLDTSVTNYSTGHYSYFAKDEELFIIIEDLLESDDPKFIIEFLSSQPGPSSIFTLLHFPSIYMLFFRTRMGTAPVALSLLTSVYQDEIGDKAFTFSYRVPNFDAHPQYEGIEIVSGGTQSLSRAGTVGRRKAGTAESRKRNTASEGNRNAISGAPAPSNTVVTRVLKPLAEVEDAELDEALLLGGVRAMMRRVTSMQPQSPSVQELAVNGWKKVVEEQNLYSHALLEDLCQYGRLVDWESSQLKSLVAIIQKRAYMELDEDIMVTAESFLYLIENFKTLFL